MTGNDLDMTDEEYEELTPQEKGILLQKYGINPPKFTQSEKNVIIRNKQ